MKRINCKVIKPPPKEDVVQFFCPCCLTFNETRINFSEEFNCRSCGAVLGYESDHPRDFVSSSTAMD